MPFIHKPIIDQWYRHLDKGESFRVVAIDDDARTVEIQDFGGDVEEVDLEDWYVMAIEPIEPPEDWTAPMDDIERDDLGYTDTSPERQEPSELMREEVVRRAAKREEVEEELPESEGESE